MSSEPVDLIAEINRRIRTSPIGAAVLLVVAGFIGLRGVIGTVVDIVGAWRTLHRGLQLTALTAISDPDSVAAFRRVWLGDSGHVAELRRAVVSGRADSIAPRGGRSGTGLPIELVPLVSRHSLRSLESLRIRDVIVTGNTTLVRRPSLPPEVVRAQRDSERARSALGAGGFPIIDLKFRNTDVSAAFLTRIEIAARRRTPFEFRGWGMLCAIVPVSWEYNVLLDPTRDTQQVFLEIAQTVEGNGVDRFVIVVGEDEPNIDAEYELDLTLHYNRGQQLHLGMARVRPTSPGCATTHPIRDVRRIKSP